VPTDQAPVDRAETTDEPPASPFRSRGPVTDGDAVDLLTHGELTLIGRMPWSSNATFLVDVLPTDPGPVECLLQGVYKPGRGERPLHDFPPGLYRREIAAWELARHLGWGLIPPTVLRDGPLGEGSVQLYVPCDYDEHYFTILEDPAHADDLRRLALFDLLVNNTDRKAGHVLAGHDGGLWAIDNSLCFHHQFKVRTVIWDFGGQPIPARHLADLARLVEDGLPAELDDLLDPFERDALLTRAKALLDGGGMPVDTSGRRVPWPLL
jgi:uncharacterized repeat protein (TIGR03843 family)